MPRQARVKGEFSTYHIIQRGNDRKNIFLSDSDKNRYIDTLIKMKNKYNFLLYAYCLMDNHVHLLINDNGNDISKLIKSINVSYVLYFNRKYRRCGHFFQNRFISELILEDSYLLQVSKYIHNNPVKACMVKKPEKYIWSSYSDYGVNRKSDLIDTSKILDSISNISTKAVREYIKYVNQTDEIIEAIDIHNDPQEDRKENNKFIESIDNAREELKHVLIDRNITMDECIENKKLRDEMIRYIRKNSVLTLKEIGSIFGGIGESRVSKILNRG